MGGGGGAVRDECLINLRQLSDNDYSFLADSVNTDDYDSNDDG